MATRVNVMGSEAKHASVASVIDDYVETKSLEYMDRKCGVKENGNETATFQLRECRRTYYKPGVYISKESSACGNPCFTSPAKLNHLVVSKQELRFSSAKEYKNTWSEFFWNIL